jgi:hypothetical protein
MIPKTISKMQHFVGKVCTIVTTSMNRDFDEKISREHFVVLVEEVTIDGIWGTHPDNSDLINFYRMDHIISVHTEEVFDPENPEHQKILEDAKKLIGKKPLADLKLTPAKLPVMQPPKKPMIENPFVDIDELEKVAESLKLQSLPESLDE